jgi:AraC-like DNA-binding protein
MAGRTPCDIAALGGQRRAYHNELGKTATAVEATRQKHVGRGLQANLSTKATFDYTRFKRLEYNGHYINIPNSGSVNLQIHQSVFNDLRAAFNTALDIGRLNPSTLLHSQVEYIQNQLMKKVAFAVASATGETDLRIMKAAGRKLKLIRRCEEFLNENLCDSFSILELAQAIGTNERSLEYYFHDVYGISPQRWIINAKLHAVRRDLQSNASQVSIQQIASQRGFHPAGRFAAAYKKLFDEYPRQTLLKRET